MKKYYKMFGIALIMAFSFYYTEQISLIVLNKSPLMITINEEKEKYSIKSVNALIDGNYIIPGVNGIEVNARDSYYRMQELEIFDKYYLSFDQVKPNISLEDNKDKIIKSGNKLHNKVAFILETENAISNYLKANNIKASLLVDLNNYQENNYFEPINNEKEGFKSLENSLNLNKENKHICLINDINKEICLKNKKYLVEPTLILKNNNLIEVKRNLLNGSIILIKENANLTDVKLLIKELTFKDLTPVPLSELISEKNLNN